MRLLSILRCYSSWFTSNTLFWCINLRSAIVIIDHIYKFIVFDIITIKSSVHFCSTINTIELSISLSLAVILSINVKLEGKTFNIFKQGQNYEHSTQTQKCSGTFNEQYLGTLIITEI
jgi:hypothetical protein